jgi:hypothetical protein
VRESEREGERVREREREGERRREKEKAGGHWSLIPISWLFRFIFRSPIHNVYPTWRRTLLVLQAHSGGLLADGGDMFASSISKLIPRSSRPSLCRIADKP